MRYRAEILGKVPYGLTHNDVFASINSMMRERPGTESVTKRRLAGNMVSIIVVFEDKDIHSAKRIMQYVSTSVNGFSADVIGPREIRG